MKKLLLVFLLALSLKATGFPSQYYDLNTNEKKEFFFSYLSKIIDEENQKILKERAVVKKFLYRGILNINFRSPEFFSTLKLKRKYRIRSFYGFDEYLNKIDVVPISLALAQAALESAWGNSRFVKEANNIFGHWTYELPGIIPQSRDENATHKIRIFPSLNSSVETYLLNLNRNRAYQSFRALRAKLRMQNKMLDGKLLSTTMDNYSGIGKRYLKILDSIITKYDLQRFDKDYK